MLLNIGLLLFDGQICPPYGESLDISTFHDGQICPSFVRHNISMYNFFIFASIGKSVLRLTALGVIRIEKYLIH